MGGQWSGYSLCGNVDPRERKRFSRGYAGCVFFPKGSCRSGRPGEPWQGTVVGLLGLGTEADRDSLPGSLASGVTEESLVGSQVGYGLSKLEEGVMNLGQIYSEEDSWDLW